MIPKAKWLIKIGEAVEGPYSKEELRLHPGLTPDLLAKRPHWSEWKRIGDIKELADLFADPEPLQPLLEECKESGALGEIVLDAKREPPQYGFWLLIALLIVLYQLLRLQGIL